MVGLPGMSPGVNFLFYVRFWKTLRAAFSDNVFANGFFDGFYRCIEFGPISLLEWRILQIFVPDNFDIKQKFETHIRGLGVVNDLDEYLFTGVKRLIGFKIQPIIAEIKYLAGRSRLLGENIMGYNRFILIALMFASFDIYAQIFPLSSSMVNWRRTIRIKDWYYQKEI